MCGIAGFAGERNDESLNRMTSALRHRGPDEAGFYSDQGNGVHFGHRRLIILDKSGGKQPMESSDKNLILVFNGEIYNHHTLRDELINRGHHFKSTHSDTEVLLHGFKEWGPKVFIKLDGMFALAILDRASKNLFLARDRMGEKPLFWSFQQNTFAFSSELPSILEHPSCHASPINQLAIAKFFAHCFFPGATTPYTGIYQIEPGSFGIFNLAERKFNLKRYWQFRIKSNTAAPSTQEELALVEKCRALLQSSVRNRLESDVPLGVFLSGGVDSSAILAFSQQTNPSFPLKAFSIGFNEKSYDELAFAEKMATFLNCEHRKKICNLDHAKTFLPKLMEEIGQPLCDGSILPTAILCEFTRQEVTVALSGDGGDELFAGYDTFKALKYAELANRLLPKIMHPALRALSGILPISHANMSLDFKIRRGIRALGEPSALWHPLWLGSENFDNLQELFTHSFVKDDVYSEVLTHWETSSANNILDKALEFYTEYYLPNNILVKSDRASMRVSLEVRAPFLSNEVVDFAANLPASMKYRNGETKHILKRALIGTIPNEIIYRKKKGFGIPLNQWLMSLDLSPPETSLGLNRAILENWATKHRKGEKDYRHVLLAALSLRNSVGHTGASR